MAQVEESGARRSVNTELNLVPFIDLMSVLITFLLITAVWTQVSMIQLGSSIHAQKVDDKQPPPVPPLADIPFRLDVRGAGFTVVIGSDRIEIPKRGADYDVPSLITRLKAIKTKYPEKIDAVITIENQLAYEFLVLGMDTLLQNGFAQITINPAEAE
jgi:biopolymer transport protein ExbD